VRTCQMELSDSCIISITFTGCRDSRSIFASEHKVKCDQLWSQVLHFVSCGSSHSLVFPHRHEFHVFLLLGQLRGSLKYNDHDRIE
jgi:hypothetical protein